MKTNKINVLEAVVAALEISDKELINWVNNRSKGPVGTGLIQTELPLVYRQGNVLTVENGLDLTRKSELWGIQLLSGVIVSLTCGSGHNVSVTTWEKIKKFAEKMHLNGKPGFLPSKYVLKERWGTEEEAKFAATVAILKENDIEADGYSGCIWCAEESTLGHACFFTLGIGLYDWGSKNVTNGYSRVALAF